MAGAAEERLRLAESFLQEAVYRSRGAQAAAGVFRSDTAPGACGLGKEAAVELELSERGAELFRALFGEGLPPERLERVRAVTSRWIERQDALDRKRNHFLKDFRNAHGFDRERYGPDEQAAYRAGLDRVNAEVDRERRAAAEGLLAG